ncbi:MAG: 3-deoxy-D-manno-octulosonic acid transferase [Bacteroidales bacterium]|nr:3-deoxy-D-manno-octulosonic acid transferase [Bacteroidales bacterium]MBQ7819657.1 3-deoxy-D-manno-octulosonic acid transferase [Bacteroidales bacterium]
MIYNLGIYLYKQAVKLVSARNPKAKLMVEGHKTLFSDLESKIEKGEKYIWIHSSSLGEFEQGRPIIEKIKKTNPKEKILLTFFSPSGYTVRKDYPLADVVSYLPFDLPGNVSRFLDIVNPKMAIFIKYEFWGNFLNELHKRAIPTYIVSAIFRENQIFFKPYGSIFRGMLKNYEHLFVQDETSKKLLAKIGVENVSVVGDTRFDRVAEIASQVKELPIFEAFSKDSYTMIIGSSWQADEDIYMDYFNSHPELKLIIAPHEINDAHMQYLMSNIKRPVLLYSQAEGKNVSEYDCIIVDCFGLLSSIYRYGNLAYIGGGFGSGIHNVPEAAVYGIPVIFGPNFKKFKEAKNLIACGGAFTISSKEEFENVMQNLSDKETREKAGAVAGEYINCNTGATLKILERISL